MVKDGEDTAMVLRSGATFVRACFLIRVLSLARTQAGIIIEYGEHYTITTLKPGLTDHVQRKILLG